MHAQPKSSRWNLFRIWHALGPPVVTEATEQWQLLTDVDDTLYAAGDQSRIMNRIAGEDDRLPAHEPYACVQKLHEEMYKKYKLSTVLVTALPSLLFTSEKKERVENAIGTETPFILLGGGLQSYRAVMQSMSRRKERPDAEKAPALWDGMAENKFRAIKQYSKTGFPPGRRPNFIFIGDSGQGDITTANKLLQQDLVQMAFIHVLPADLGLRRAAQKTNLFFFCDYRDVIDTLVEKKVLPPGTACPENSDRFAYSQECTWSSM